MKSYELRFVQFSHFSAKEFMTATQLATSSGDTSQYHILLELVHTILAKACLSVEFSVLLRVDDCVEQSGVRNNSSLAKYVAQHWVAHAQVDKVSSCLQRAMEYLFDPNKPYFAAWLKLNDIDTNCSRLNRLPLHTLVEIWRYSIPLYYATLCGFQDLVEHLTVNDPKHVNAKGNHLTPLVAALAAGIFRQQSFSVTMRPGCNLRRPNSDRSSKAQPSGPGPVTTSQP